PISCFLTHPSPPETSPLSLHDALPILTAAVSHRCLRTGAAERRAGRQQQAQVLVRIGIAQDMLGRREQPPQVDQRRDPRRTRIRSEEHTSELQSLAYLVCRLLLEKKKK